MPALQSLSELWPPKSKFSEDDIPNLEGRVVVVTGANTGIGKRICQVLVSKNAKVYLCARNKEKGLAAVEDIRKAVPDAQEEHILFHQLDLSDIKKVKQSAEDFKKKETKLHLLFNNAGVMATPSDSRSADGYELQFATNVLGPFVFTQSLLPLLLSSADPEHPGLVRVVNTSSSAVGLAPKGGVNLEDLTLKNAHPMIQYGQSKLGNVLYSNELARRCGPQGIWSFSLNPGNIQTELTRHNSWHNLLWKFVAFPIRKGALTSLFAGTSTDIKPEQNGAYLIPFARFGSVGSG